jgi:hypothetical protein
LAASIFTIPLISNAELSEMGTYENPIHIYSVMHICNAKGS